MRDYEAGSASRNWKPSREAYEWFTLLHSGNLTDKEFRDYLKRVEENPPLEREVEDLEKLWGLMSVLKAVPPPSLSSPNPRPPSRLVKLAGKLWNPAAAVAAALAAVTVLAAAIYFQDILDGGEVYETARAETTVINLLDGSTAHLNVLSRIRVRYSDGERRVILDEGEASFSVASDAGRPFTVVVGDSEVRALGTEFNVKIDPARTVAVTLVEGTIQVSQVSNAQEAGVREINTLNEPGQQARMRLAPLDTRRISVRSAPDRSSEPIEISRTSLSTALSWRDGKIVFEGETLAEAVVEINRYTRHSIQLAGPELATMPVYGVFNSGDWEGFLSAVEQSYPLSRDDSRSGTTILRHKEGGG